MKTKNKITAGSLVACVYLLTLTLWSCEENASLTKNETLPSSDQVKASQSAAFKTIQGGVAGFTYDSIGNKLGGVTIVFQSTLNTEDQTTIISGAAGDYKIALTQGNYFFTASKAGFVTYSTIGNGWVVAGKTTYTTNNIFLNPLSSQ